MSIILSQYPLYYARVLFLMCATIIINYYLYCLLYSMMAIIEIMIVMYCVYINATSTIQKHYNISPILSFS